MRKFYRPSANIFAILSVVTAICLIVGIVLLISSSNQIGLAIGLTMGSVFPFFLFITLFFFDYFSYLQIDETKIIFPRCRRTITNNGKRTLFFKKLEVHIQDIVKIDKRYYKGDHIISKDATFYIFKLKNGDYFEETLFSYGKKQEEEINDILKDKFKHKK